MRLPASILALTAFLVGCSTDDGAIISQTINISSNPSSAAVRLNGSAVGRTPTTITVESNSDYQLEIGKGGYSPSITELKPALKTDSKGNMFYGFPEKISVSLDRLPGSDEVKVPESDERQFKQLARKAVATSDQKVAEPGSSESLKNSVVDVKEDVDEVKQKLAKRDADAAAKLDGLKKSLVEVKSPEGQKADDQRIAVLEAQIATQEKAAAADRQSTAELLKALTLRNEELIRLNNNSVNKDEADKQLASVQRVMEEQKAIAAKADEQRASAELESKKRTYAEFNSRYALLESRRRNKLITEEEFKQQLSALRQELTK